MGKYNYEVGERELNKVLKLNQQEIEKAKENIETIKKTADATIKSSESLLKSLGHNTEISAPINRMEKEVPVRENIKIPEWEDLLQQANNIYTEEVDLEDLLSEEEFSEAYQNLNEINEAFSEKTGLNETDIAFLILASAIQTLRWVLMPQIGETIDANTRLSDKDGDAKVKELKKKYAENHSDWKDGKSSQGSKLRKEEGKTWKEIVFASVPYDATAGSPAQNINMGGKYHRYKTLGHDPVLGWFFGTANILTDTLTLNNFVSYRIKKMKFTDEIISLPILIAEVNEQICSDFHKLPAAVFRQAIHFKSDQYTKLGLPVPLLGAFSETLAGNLYRSQYDALCLLKDVKIVSASAVLSVVINMAVGVMHGLFYNEVRDSERELYEARTRKILCYSNVLSSLGNGIISGLIKSPKSLDFGGLIVTITRVFTDSRFIIKLKEEFINTELDLQLQVELNEIDKMLSEYNII